VHVLTEPSFGMGLVIVRIVLLSATACTASQPPPRASFQPGIGDVPKELQSDYESFAVNCSKCHHIDRALAAPVTDVLHWDIYVAKMMRTAGSAISADERPHILRFLYWYTERKNARLETKDDTLEIAPTSAPSVEAREPARDRGTDAGATQGESTP
jgi:hypothetical protein